MAEPVVSKPATEAQPEPVMVPAPPGVMLWGRVESAWPMVRAAMAAAYRQLLADAFQLAADHNLPMDGSWHFEVESVTEERNGAAFFTVRGAWRKVA